MADRYRQHEGDYVDDWADYHKLKKDKLPVSGGPNWPVISVWLFSLVIIGAAVGWWLA